VVHEIADTGQPRCQADEAKKADQEAFGRIARDILDTEVQDCDAEEARIVN